MAVTSHKLCHVLLGRGKSLFPLTLRMWALRVRGSLQGLSAIVMTPLQLSNEVAIRMHQKHDTPYELARMGEETPTHHGTLSPFIFCPLVQAEFYHTHDIWTVFLAILMSSIRCFILLYWCPISLQGKSQTFQKSSKCFPRYYSNCHGNHENKPLRL
jgi:hypothetical protein